MMVGFRLTMVGFTVTVKNEGAVKKNSPKALRRTKGQEVVDLNEF